MPGEVFGTAVTCIDGRVHNPLRSWALERWDIDHLDLVTLPGPDRVLASGTPGEVGEVTARVSVSGRAHASTLLIVAGHTDCAGDPVPAARHRAQIIEAVARCSTLLPGWHVVGVLVHLDQGVVRVEEVTVHADPCRSSTETGPGVSQRPDPPSTSMDP